MVTIQLNGSPHSIPSNTTISQLIDQLELDAHSVIAELNGEIHSREKWSTAILEASDTLELLHFLGGGSV